MTARLSITSFFVLLFCVQFAVNTAAWKNVDAGNQLACDCDLENKLHFVNLLSRAQEHSVPTTFTIDVRDICDRNCVVFGKLPSTPEYVHQGNWSIDRDGTITFDHRPHKTGVALLNITVEEVSGSSNYTAHTSYRIVIAEDPDYPMVFASKEGVAAELTEFDASTEQFKNVTFSVEQNTGNNTAYADLLFTAGAFDYDADENIRVTDESPRLGQIIGGVGGSPNSSVPLLEPLDCELPDSDARLRNRSLTEWDVSLPKWHPCNLTLPYDASELSWFAHLLRYRPGLQQTGLDRFVLAYTDKYRLQARLHVHVHILQNPCINGGLCWGPTRDPDCTSHDRSSGFFNNGYLCQCEPGWVGDRCEIDFDDCSSSPCPSPFVCVDKFRGYDCICPDNLARCQPILKPWQLSAVILGIVAGVCAVAAVVILASQRSPFVLPLTKKISSDPEAPPPGEAAAADDVSEMSAAEPPEDDVDDPATRGFDLAEPSTTPPVTFTEAESQSDPIPTAKDATEKSSSRSSARPPNPQPPAEDRYQQTFHRGSILIPRRRTGNAWKTPEPFLEEDHALGDADAMSGRGAGSPSDAWRLQELRRTLRNRQAMEEF